MTPIRPPDIAHPADGITSHRPSWSSGAAYVNDEHRGIYEATKGLPGWQDPPDSEKLYEIAYHSGQIILEIGVFGGRSAVVELRGAMAGARDRALAPPQFFGVDVDPGFLSRSLKTITDAGLADRCLLYHGDVRRFLGEVPILPTMVFVDGDHRYPGVWADLDFLGERLVPGTPVLCHDYGGIPGVRDAVDAWIARGTYERMGQFAGSMLLRVASTRRGAVPSEGRALSPGCFDRTRAALLGRYLSKHPPNLRRHAHCTPVRDLTAEAREELLGRTWARARSGRGPWPYAAPDTTHAPPTMPGGHPWPRISIVTPSFNQGRYIEETILSVLNQGYPDVEHIVMDGGSTDETLAILDRYRDRLAHASSEKDKGQSDAINKGMARATGRILTWLNSDDMLAPGALAAIAMAFQTSGADLVAGECHIHRNGKLVQKHLTGCPDGPLPLDELLDIEHCWMTGQFFYQPEVMFTRELWDKAGARVSTDLYHSLDYELWARFAEQGARLHVIGRPVALFRAHDEQKTAGTVVGGFRVELPKVRDSILARLGRTRVEHPPARPLKARLRVVMFNDLGYSFGAGIAHRRLAEALAGAGHEVHAVAAATNQPHQQINQVAARSALEQVASLKPDLVVMGNLHGADLDATVLGLIAERFPTAFVLHDKWVLTGRCAYANGCRRYLTGCAPRECTCDTSHPKLAPELVAPAWEAKRRIIGSSPNLVLLANSAWALRLLDEAMDHAPPAGLRDLRRPPTDRVEFGLELDDFRPRDKSDCREALGLPRDRFVIMSSASSLRDPRKGLRHLADALRLLDLPDTLVTCVGWFAADETLPIPGMRAMGYMKDRRQIAMLYAAADLFVGPSLEEAFGQVFIEAAACATPSVGYPVGGVPEAIRDGVSGLVASAVNPAALADAIDELYSNPRLRADLGRWGRLWVENEWSLSASYHRLACAMRRTGLADRIGLGRKIDLALDPKPPGEPILVRPTFPAWREVSGFGPWEGPYPARNLPRCRWAFGPTAAFELDAERTGPARLLIGYHCSESAQRVRVVQGGRTIAERVIPCNRHDAGEHVLSLDVKLRIGPNPFELHFWKWRFGHAKPAALLVTSITSVPEPAGVGGALPAVSPAPKASAKSSAIEAKPAGVAAPSAQG